MLTANLGILAQNGGGDAAAAAAGGIFMIVWLVFLIACVAAMWVVFQKAGKPGWACLIPIYNIVVLLEIIGRPIWWILLFFIPFVNIIIAILVNIDLAKSFGKGTGFAIGLIFLGPIFLLMLAFGDAKYLGPAGGES